MGFQIIAQQVRNDNYSESAEYHNTQKEMIMKALPHLYLTINKQIVRGCSSASRIYDYLIKNEIITAKTPLTSIRRALNNMAHPKEGSQILIEYGEVKSILYDSTETIYKFKEMKENKNQTTLF